VSDQSTPPKTDPPEVPLPKTLVVSSTPTEVPLRDRPKSLASNDFQWRGRAFVTAAVVASVVSLVGIGLVADPTTRATTGTPNAVPIDSAQTLCAPPPSQRVKVGVEATAIRVAIPDLAALNTVGTTSPSGTPSIGASPPPSGTPVTGSSSQSAPVPPAGGSASSEPAAPASDGPESDARTSVGSVGAQDNLLTIDGVGRAGLLALTTPDTIAVAAQGPAAAVLAAETSTVRTAGDERGLAAQPCPAPSTDVWFIGASSAVGHRSVLTLSATSVGSAQVDVEIYGPQGEVSAPDGRGVVVPSGEDVALRLDSLAPGLAHASVHVVVRAGRVAASMIDSAVTALTPLGATYLPPTAPARDLVIAGSPAGSGRRTLIVTNPGQVDATARVSLLTAEGSYAPAGAESLDIPAGQTITADLGPAAAGASFATRLNSDYPLLAAVESSTGAPTADRDIVSAAPPGTSPVIAAGLLGGVQHALVVAAPDADGVVSVELYAPQANPALPGGAALAPVGTPSTVNVGKGQQVELSISVPLASSGTVVVVRPAAGSGAVSVVRRETRTSAAGPLSSTVRFTAVAPPVTLTDVTEDLSIVLPAS